MTLKQFRKGLVRVLIITILFGVMIVNCGTAHKEYKQESYIKPNKFLRQ